MSPPSSVRTSSLPCWVVMTQSFGVAQRIEVSCLGAMPRPFGVHVAPPSLVVRNSEPSPTAMPSLASKNRIERTERSVSATSVHEFAPSVVR